uniref:S-methyl-5-thioribose kinase n=1 Tax=Ndongobacter massiliensis TaxID=1871025 RepID=UPI0009316B50|nr:S-methyl-5-thioribose kinase [Ndongobacter massiliensis]
MRSTEESKLLSKDAVCEYIARHFEEFRPQSRLDCEEIGDGNINYVFRVINRANGKSLVAKQADVLLRSSGRPLDIHRSQIEAEWLQRVDALLPHAVPKVYLYDASFALLVMEDISAYKNLRKQLLFGEIDKHLSESLARFLAETLLPTTDLVVGRGEKKKDVQRFINPELCDISEDLVFTEPYYDYKKRNVLTPGTEAFVQEKLYENEALIAEVLLLKDDFQNRAQALLHGDLHSGSIFSNADGMKVIDPEFAFYGPMGYDIGNVWGNLCFPLFHHLIAEDDAARVSALTSLVQETVDKTIADLHEVYEKQVTFPYYRNSNFKKRYLRAIVDDSFGYAGTEIIRRVVGDSKVLDVTSVEDPKQRIRLDQSLLTFGIALILRRKQLQTGQDVLGCVRESVQM